MRMAGRKPLGDRKKQPTMTRLDPDVRREVLGIAEAAQVTEGEVIRLCVARALADVRRDLTRRDHTPKKPKTAPVGSDSGNRHSCLNFSEAA